MSIASLFTRDLSGEEVAVTVERKVEEDTPEPVDLGPATPVLVYGTGPVAVAAVKRFIAQEWEVLFATPDESEEAALSALGAKKHTDESYKSLLIVDEFSSILSNEDAVGLVKEGVEFVARLCTIGTCGGGWFKHRFGESDVIDRHSAAVESLAATGVPLGTVNAGVLAQTFAKFLGGISKVSKELANPIGEARMSFIDSDDVAEGLVKVVTERMAGKRIGLNGCRSASFEQLGMFLNSMAGEAGLGSITVVPVLSSHTHTHRIHPTAYLCLNRIPLLQKDIDTLIAELQSTAGVSESDAKSFGSLMALAAKSGFDNTSDDCSIALGRKEVMLDEFLKASSAEFLPTA